MRVKQTSKLQGVYAVVATALLVGCQPNTGVGDVKAAVAMAESGNLSGGIVALKGLLQSAPNNSEARLHLAKLLVRDGNFAEAEIELRKARQQGAPDNLVVPLLAQTLIQQRKLKTVLEEFSSINLSDALADAALKASHASALAMQGKPEDALALIDRSLVSAPTSAHLKLVRSRLLAGKGEVEAAQKLAREAASIPELKLESLLLSAALELHIGNSAAAESLYRKALEDDRLNLAARTALVTLLLNRKDVAAARKEFDAMEQVLPKHPQTYFLKTQFLLLDEKYAEARDILQQLMRQTIPTPAMLQVAGAVELQLGSLAQAESHLAKALAQQPALEAARRLLAATYLRGGQPQRALAVLQPLLQATTPHFDALTLAGDANLQLGDATAADALFRRAAAIRPNDVRIQTAIALAQISSGRAELGIESLQALTSRDEGTFADKALIATQTRRGEWQAALQAIDRLEAKEPKQANAAHLRGVVNMSRRDERAARDAFTEALRRQPDYLPSLTNLVRMDVRVGALAEARQRLDSVLTASKAAKPDLLLLNAELKIAENRPKEDVVATLEQSVKADPKYLSTRLSLLGYLLKKSDPKGAVAVAEAGLVELPDHPELLSALGQAQTAAGQTQQAIKTFSKLMQLSPGRTTPMVMLSDTYLAANEPDQALSVLRRAYELAPDEQVVVRSLIRLLMRRNDTDGALKIAKEQQTRYPGLANGFLLEADIHADRRNWSAALASLRTSLTKAKPGLAQSKIFSILKLSKRDAEAAEFAQDWVRQHPKDSDFAVFVGDWYISRSEWEAAEPWYQKAVEIDPSNGSSLNNLAWLMAKLKRPEAVKTAERAVVLAPQSANALDTLSFALLSIGQSKDAVAAAERALKISEQPSFRLTLAKALLASGRKSDALTQLKSLERLGTQFQAHKEVKELLSAQ